MGNWSVKFLNVIASSFQSYFTNRVCTICMWELALPPDPHGWSGEGGGRVCPTENEVNEMNG